MDRATLILHLAEAERHVTDGEDRITWAIALVADLKAAGRDTQDGEELLKITRDTQEAFVSHRDWLRTELAKLH